MIILVARDLVIIFKHIESNWAENNEEIEMKKNIGELFFSSLPRYLETY